MMPVWKYRNIGEMPDVWKLHKKVAVGRRARAILRMGVIAGPLGIPRGVHKFHSIEELGADRRRYERDRVARIRTKRAQKR
jgi:hypothetical protein